jgi:hypothetical protein
MLHKRTYAKDALLGNERERSHLLARAIGNESPYADFRHGRGADLAAQLPDLP